MDYVIDDNFLKTVGIEIADQNKKQTKIDELSAELEMRVGNRIIENFTDEQVDEFEAIMDKQDPDKSLEWLELNYPDYKKIVVEEFEKLKSDIKSGKL